ncbi:TRAP transporter large permease [Jiangella muralis]|uniref:TRAP transporter large permease n=1 Tax=Jiangella muralis TaxID=702383 RepID=UPI00069EE7FD|nr:TRAP transporter large permease [Jiangella muralis]
METVVLFLTLFACMGLGLSVWVSMGVAALVTIGALGLGDATSLPTAMAKGIGNFELLAIPFFILTGELLNRTGMTERILRLMMYFLGRYRGGLAYASVGVNVAVSGVSGSAPADASAVSSVMLPAMKKEGYRPEFAAAVNASAAVIGPIAPPSIPMIFVALVTNLSVGKLFLGGVVPALLLAGSMVLLIMWNARRGLLPQTERVPRRAADLGPLTLAALPALGAPVLLIGGILTGFATITELSILAAAYVLFLGLVVYRTLTPRDLLPLFRDGAVFSATIMILFAVVGAFSYVLTVGDLATGLSSMVEDLNVGPVAFILLAMVFFLIVGMPMDAVPAILIFLPILLPVATELGIDPIHFGVIVVVNLMLGLLTWPVGALLYVLTKMSGVSFGKLSVAVLPFLAVMIGVLLLLALVPGLVTWLPEVAFGG